MSLQPCNVCRSMVAATAATCPSCGIRRSNFVAAQQPQNYAPQPHYAQASHGVVQPIPQQALSTLQIANVGGGVCPRCYSYLRSNHYTWAHLLIAILCFPLGLLVLFAPVRRCQCGNKYGLGRWIVSVCVWLIVAAAVVGLLALALMLRGAKTS